MDSHIKRLVMVKLSCSFCGTDELLRACTAPFDSQVGLFACVACLGPVETEVHAALRNVQSYALYPLDDRTPLTIKRSDGSFEQWAPIDFATWSAHFDTASTAPVVLSNNTITLMMMSTTLPHLFRHHVLRDVMALNPHWNPCIRIDRLLAAAHQDVWVNAADLIGAAHEIVAST